LEFELPLLEKIKVDGNDVMSLKFSKQNEQADNKTSLDYLQVNVPFLI
jgi:hypothetical protein